MKLNIALRTKFYIVEKTQSMHMSDAKQTWTWEENEKEMLTSSEQPIAMWQIWYQIREIDLFFH